MLCTASSCGGYGGLQLFRTEPTATQESSCRCPSPTLVLKTLFDETRSLYTRLPTALPGGCLAQANGDRPCRRTPLLASGLAVAFEETRFTRQAGRAPAAG